MLIEYSKGVIFIYIPLEILKKNDVGQIGVPLMEKLTFGQFVPFFKLQNNYLLFIANLDLLF